MGKSGQADHFGGEGGSPHPSLTKTICENVDPFLSFIKQQNNPKYDNLSRIFHIFLTQAVSLTAFFITSLKAEWDAFGKLDESEEIQQIYDFLKSHSEKRRAERSVDRELIASQAQVLIKEKLSKISIVLNTWGNKLLLHGWWSSLLTPAVQKYHLRTDLWTDWHG